MKPVLPSVICAVAGFAAGYLVCSQMVKPAPAVPASVQEQAQEIRNIAQPLMNNMLEAMQKNDIKQFTKDFQPELLSSVNPNDFKTQREILLTPQGTIEKPIWIGAYRKDTTIITIWKIKDNKGTGDILINLSLLSLDQHVKAIGFYLQ